MFKTVRSAALILAMAAAALTACSPGGNDSSSQASSGPAASSAPAQANTCDADGQTANYFVNHMKAGEVCWADPHSLWLDQNGAFRLDKKSSVATSQMADATMPITCLADSNYQVALTASEKASYKSTSQPANTTTKDTSAWVQVQVTEKK